MSNPKEKGMTEEESDKFHEYADLLWELAGRAKSEGFVDLADSLISMSDILHARASGLRKKYESLI